MINRLAEMLFWIGRYVERAENHARLIDVNYHARQEQLGSPHEREYVWERLVSAVGDIERYKSSHTSVNELKVLHFMTFERSNPNSIFSCIQQARNNVRALRQLLPSELWEIINGAYLWLKEQTVSQVMLQSPYLFYQRLREWTSLFNGAADSAMVRGQEWNFIQLGKHLERAENTARVVRAFYTNSLRDASVPKEQHEHNRSAMLLKALGAHEAYRKQYATDMASNTAITFIMGNNEFPRSITFAAASLDHYLKASVVMDPSFDGLAKQANVLVAISERIGKGPEPDVYDNAREGLNRLVAVCHQLGNAISSLFYEAELVGG
ncbi:alpha-E domain-containing protein [Paenibacillus sp. MMS18-CY102]|uniref:alpha-E domain-containing protein n=1 Tax=Paenibacillus sp. MMS18-CY102 TaxID=2682849 RepID=UPI0013653AE1|nr:alpha-E domain-containing protein [Paenibacillus sp. MMS18-CY102]MWC31196.1 alpha-E domain-containing protein [Paenibacillus sp. MMS18-CY102]